MEFVIKGRKPESVFRYFEEISAIPRGSYHESGIATYLERFAGERGLACYRDAANNVLIKAPASSGMEACPPLLLQGHTDMVCEKNRGVEHDFEKDPLKLYVDGNYLRAEGTTLGADDGIAVAIMLALLDGEIQDHPPYECLFTSAEEVGLDGAIAFDYSLIKARRMLNLDNEDLPIVTAGCAGGLRSDIMLSCQTEPTKGTCLRLQIKGLMGGHSGVNISGGRANANKLMGRMLASVQAQTAIHLISVNGGSKDNAIPRECEALLAAEHPQAVREAAAALAQALKAELSQDDRGFSVVCEEIPKASEMMTSDATQKVIALLHSTQNGVLKMSEQIKGLVEWSRNMGVVKTEKDQVTVTFSARSSLETQLDASIQELDLLTALLGGSVSHHSRYPGWSYAEESPLREAYLQSYRAVTGENATVNVIHAGLECGVIGSHLPDMDIISIGPDMKDIHSPDEALDLASTETFFRILANLIEKG